MLCCCGCDFCGLGCSWRDISDGIWLVVVCMVPIVVGSCSG